MGSSLICTAEAENLSSNDRFFAVSQVNDNRIAGTNKLRGREEYFLTPLPGAYTQDRLALKTGFQECAKVLGLPSKRRDRADHIARALGRREALGRPAGDIFRQAGKKEP